MRKLLSLTVAVLFAGTLGACEEQPTNPEASVSQHTPGAVLAVAELDAVDTEAAENHDLEPGDEVGTIRVADDRNADKLTVTGDAKGLDPNNEAGYFSLFYDVESNANSPDACEPALGFDDESDTDKQLTLGEMIVGGWNVHPNGTANLPSVKKTGADYIPTSLIGTVSIRDLRINGGIGPEAVVACGAVVAK